MLRSRYALTCCCREEGIPESIEAEKDFRCLEIIGPFDLASVGVVAAAAGAVAREGVSLFMFSTWETDFFLVRAKELFQAIEALRAEGHTVHSDALQP